MSFSNETLQEVIDINNSVEIANATTAFDAVVDSNADMTALKDHYFNVIYYFDKVKTLMNENREANYGCNAPEAMLEYISDRATAAQTDLEKREGAGTFTNPGDGAQEKTLYWFDDSGSGSSSGSGSGSASSSSS